MSLKAFSCLIFLLVVLTTVHAQQLRVGSLEYFGTKDVDVEKVRRSLNALEGEQMNLEDLPKLTTQVKTSVKSTIGAEPTDVATVCCDGHDRWTIYIGLTGKNSQPIKYNPTPKGKVHFQPEVVTLYQQAMDLLMESVHAQAKEERTEGYALSSYPPLRAKQMAMREYALGHAALIRQVLNDSADKEQRVVAAQLLGYAAQDDLQIRSLLLASRDREETVRNNAVRALGVLAESNTTIARKIPAQGFIDMLNSGGWTDRNKVGYLLSILTKSREPHLLNLIREGALDSLLEMAVWRDYGHAQSSRFILGRIAGIPEDNLPQIAVESVQSILRKFESDSKNRF